MTILTILFIINFIGAYWAYWIVSKYSERLKERFGPFVFANYFGSWSFAAYTLIFGYLTDSDFPKSAKITLFVLTLFQWALLIVAFSYLWGLGS